jgi:hypothetical protein
MARKPNTTEIIEAPAVEETPPPTREQKLQALADKLDTECDNTTAVGRVACALREYFELVLEVPQA